MRLPRGGDHSTTVALMIDFGASPAFFKDPRRGCAPEQGVDPETFFREDLAQRAKKVCRSCPFRNQCDAWATVHHERWGVWGGRLRSPRLSRRLAEDDVIHLGEGND